MALCVIRLDIIFIFISQKYEMVYWEIETGWDSWQPAIPDVMQTFIKSHCGKAQLQWYVPFRGTNKTVNFDIWCAIIKALFRYLVISNVDD